MQINFVDEYGESLLDSRSEYIPSIGDTVSIDDEDWRVKSRTFIPKQNGVVIELTQTQVRLKATDDEVGARLKEMQRAIVEVNKRQDVHEKKSRILREQLVSVRTHLRTQQK